MLSGLAPISRQHVTTLDGLRGLAIIMVLGIHFHYAVIPPRSPFLHWTNPIVVSGWMGVDLFFVLSGFLITGILLDTKNSANYFRSFYARRTLRIFPLYYLVIITSLSLTPWLLKSLFLSTLIPKYSDWISYLFYMQNWWLPLTGKGLTNLVGAYWSLGVEEQFYLLWPLVVFKLDSRRLVSVCLSLVVLCPVFRLVLLRHNPTSIFVLTNTLTRMDTLLWGGLAAVIVRNPNLLKRIAPLLNYVIFICFSILFIIDFGLHELYPRAFYTQSLGYTAIAVGFTALLLKAYLANSGSGPLTLILRNPILRSFGRYSYGIYIFHVFILLAIQVEFSSRPWFGKSVGHWLVLAGIFLFSSYFIAFGSFHVYESQFLRLKPRFKARIIGNVEAT